MKKIYFAIITIAVMLCGVSCVKDQMYQGPATISEVNFTPGSVQPWDEVTVTATISDLRSIKSAIVKYTVNGTQATVAMSNSGEKYTGVIPQQADKAEVNFNETMQALNKHIEDYVEKISNNIFKLDESIPFTQCAACEYKKLCRTTYRVSGDKKASRGLIDLRF